MRKLVCAALLLCCSMVGEAQNKTPMGTCRGFLQACGPQKHSEDPTLRSIEENYDEKMGAVCNAYIFGIYQGIDFAASMIESVDPNKKSHRFICVPDGTQGYELKNTVISFLQKFPGLLDIGTPSITSSSLSEAFPCQDKNSVHP